jgi:hypothetical protein
LYAKLHIKKHTLGRVAQSVEQRIENPRVASSILAPATSYNKAHRDAGFFNFYLRLAPG